MWPTHCFSYRFRHLYWKNPWWFPFFFIFLFLFTLFLSLKISNIFGICTLDRWIKSLLTGNFRKPQTQQIYLFTNLIDSRVFSAEKSSWNSMNMILYNVTNNEKKTLSIVQLLWLITRLAKGNSWGCM